MQSGQKTNLRTICKNLQPDLYSTGLLKSGSYLFGGFGGPNGTGLGDLYVLSIPSFQWVLVSEYPTACVRLCSHAQIWPIPQQLMYPNGKGWLSCNVFRESQMLIIGGSLTNTSYSDCDNPRIGGQHNMLLGQEYEEITDGTGPNWWHAPLDNVTGYRVPSQLTEHIGGEYAFTSLEIRQD